MPINVMWKDDSKKVLVFVFDGQWDVNDFFAITDKGNLMLDDVSHPVDMVLDIQKSKSIPRDFMNAIRNTPRKVHPNSGIMIMVGINVFARAFISMYRKVYPKKAGEKSLYYAGNYDEAQAIIDGLAAKDNLKMLQ